MTSGDDAPGGEESPRLPEPTLPEPAPVAPPTAPPSAPPPATPPTTLPPPPPTVPPPGGAPQPPPPPPGPPPTWPPGPAGTPAAARPAPPSLAPWLLAAAALTALAAVLTFARYRNEEVPFMLGAVSGTIAFVVLIGALFSLKSRRAAYIAATVVAGLAVLGTVGQNLSDNQTAREIDDAMEELGIDGGDPIDLTRSEERCLEDSGYDEDDLLTALTDAGLAGSASQLELIDVIAECAPHALLTDANVEGFRTEFSTGIPGEITEDEAFCVMAGLVQQPRPSALLDGTDTDGLPEIIVNCLGDDSLSRWLGEEGTGPQAIGDDPWFDRLAERCTDGDEVACDLLYGLSAINSEYETLAADCAGRDPGNELVCTPGMLDRDGNGYLDNGSPGWPAVTGACERGDMAACDFTFANSEPGSEIETIGGSCGGRRVVLTGGSCHDRFGETAPQP